MTRTKVAKPVAIPTNSPGRTGTLGPLVGIMISEPGLTDG